jgi:hypothetical protein
VKKALRAGGVVNGCAECSKMTATTDGLPVEEEVGEPKFLFATTVSSVTTGCRQFVSCKLPSGLHLVQMLSITFILLYGFMVCCSDAGVPLYYLIKY